MQKSLGVVLIILFTGFSRFGHATDLKCDDLLAASHFELVTIYPSNNEYSKADPYALIVETEINRDQLDLLATVSEIEKESFILAKKLIKSLGAIHAYFVPHNLEIVNKVTGYIEFLFSEYRRRGIVTDFEIGQMRKENIEEQMWFSHFFFFIDSITKNVKSMAQLYVSLPHLMSGEKPTPIQIEKTYPDLILPERLLDTPIPIFEIRRLGVGRDIADGVASILTAISHSIRVILYSGDKKNQRINLNFFLTRFLKNNPFEEFAKPTGVIYAVATNAGAKHYEEHYGFEIINVNLPLKPGETTAKKLVRISVADFLERHSYRKNFPKARRRASD